MNSLDRLNIIENRIEKLVDIYEANQKDIEQINAGIGEPDYGLEECIKIKEDLELKIQALNMEKDLLSTEQ
jgi:hypothetical protein